MPHRKPRRSHPWRSAPLERLDAHCRPAQAKRGPLHLSCAPTIKAEGTPLNALKSTLTNPPVSVHSKALTRSLTPLFPTLTKTGGVPPPPPFNFPTNRIISFAGSELTRSTSQEPTREAPLNFELSTLNSSPYCGFFFLPNRPPSWPRAHAASPPAAPARPSTALPAPPAQLNCDFSKLAVAPPTSGTNCGFAVVP